jgi:hypothetical protein
VRSTLHYYPALHHPVDVFSPMEEHPVMFAPFRHPEANLLVQERIHALQEIANELRVTPPPRGGHTNLVSHTRALIGRRLMSLGSAVAGQHAA